MKVIIKIIIEIHINFNQISNKQRSIIEGFDPEGSQCRQIRTLLSIQKYTHLNQQCNQDQSKMTTAYQYFESPFLDDSEAVVEPWCPAFPEEEDGEHHLAPCSSVSEERRPPEDLPEVMSVVSYEGDPKRQSNQDNEGILLDELSLLDEGLQLADLQNIDISLPEPISKPPSKPKEESLGSLFAEQERQRFLQRRGEGRVLSVQKYEGNRHDEEWVRRLDKTIAARAFVYRGYGINYLKEELRSGNYDKFTLDETKYKSISGSMTREAYRKLESFLARDCQRKLHTLSGYEMKLLQTLLLNCRSTLPRAASTLFLEIVKLTYTLDDSTICEADATLLYEAIYRALQRKISLLRGHSPSQRSSDQRRRRFGEQLRQRVGEQEELTEEGEREVIREYITQHSVSKMRDNLRARNILGEGATVKTIRNILRRVLRSTIRRVENLLNEGVKEYRSLSKMPDEQIKWVIESSEGLEARKQLCRIHLQERDDRRIFETVYQNLRSLIQKRDSFHGIFTQGRNAH